MLPDPNRIVPVYSAEQEARDNAALIDIMAYLSQARADCREWHEQIRHWRQLYNFRHYTEAAKAGETQYADPTYTNVVDLAVGIILGNRLDWTAFSWEPSQKDTTTASMIEKYLAGLLDINNEREEMSIPYEVNLNFVRDGCCVIFSPWDPQIAAWSSSQVKVADPDNEAAVQTVRQFDEPPLRIKVIDPLKIMPMLGGPNRWARIFRIEKMRVRDVELNYNVTLRNYAHLDTVQKGLTEDELIDYWCWMPTPPELVQAVKRPIMVFNAVLFGREFVIPLRPMLGYDDLPFTIGFFKPVDRDRAEGWGHSIMKPLETSMALLERSVNRRQRLIDVYASLPPVARTRGGRVVTVDPAIGGVITLNEGEDFGFPTWPGSAPDVQQNIDLFRARAQQSGFSDVMFGAGSSQISGFALTQLGDQNRIRLTQPVEHLQLFWTNWAHKVLSLTIRYARNSVVRVYGTRKGATFAEQVRGLALEGFRVKCKVTPVFPNEETRKHAMATQVKEMLSEETIMQRYLGIEQPDEEKKRRMQEMAQSHPLMVQYMLLATLADMAKDGDEVAAQVLTQMQQQGLPSQPGPDSQPRKMEQFAGMRSPTGQPTPQERGMPAPGQSESDQLERMAGAAPNMEGGY